MLLVGYEFHRAHIYGHIFLFRFPLFCRHIPPPDSFLYAVFLLNQNIGQIKFMLGLHGQRDDIRATLPNLMSLLNAIEIPSTYLTSTNDAAQSVASITASGQTLILNPNDSTANLASVSNSSVDLNVPVPVRVPIVRGTHSLSDGDLNLPDIRYSEFLFIF